MRIMIPMVACLLVGAAPADVPVGRFQTWSSFKKVPLTFNAGGVSVRVEALPCPAQPVGDSACGWEGYNNQAKVTVTAPGRAPVTITTDRQSSYARVAVVRFDRRDRRPGVIVESQYGGSGGNMTMQLVIPVGHDYRVAALDGYRGSYLQGGLADLPRDLSGDGRIDLKLEDGAFDSAFGCNACTPRPPLVFAVKQGRIVDESRDPALRGVFAEDMARLAPICLSDAHERNGACAAYVADAARAGSFKRAWALMLAHYEHDDDRSRRCDLPATAWTDHRCPEGHLTPFPAALHAFLVLAGYLAG